MAERLGVRTLATTDAGIRIVRTARLGRFALVP
jgi:hypothetical protein